MNNAFAQAAIEYAEMGYAVFPCVPGMKGPLTRNGNLDATTDVDVISEWWEAYPTANVAITTSGLIVIDVDDKDGNKNEWPTNPDAATSLQDAALSVTPRGGRHFIFRQPADRNWRNTASVIAKDVDTRGNGGYILAAPSIVKGKHYTWVNELCDPVDLPEPPEWLARMLDELASGADAGQRTSKAEASNTIPNNHRNDTLMRLGCGMRRNGMSEQSIESALLTENALRCDSPMTDREVQKIAWSVSRYSPDQIAVAVVESHFAQDQEEEPPAHTPTDPGEFPPSLLNVPGFVGEVMAFNLETAHRPQPVLALAGALSLQAVLAARKVMDERGNRTNLYIVGAAPSGSGKDRARKVNKEVLYMSGFDKLEGNEDFASDSGMLKAIDAQPAILFQIDEIGRLLKTASDSKTTHLYNIVTAFLRLYSSADSIFKGKAYADNKNNLTIDQPCVCLYGLTIPEMLYQSITFEALTDGFLARLLIIDITDRGVRKEVVLKDVPESIIKVAKWWGNFAPGGNLADRHPQPDKIVATAEARAEFTALAKIVDAEAEAGDAAAQALWARAEEKACRLALVYACSKNYEERVVDGAAAKWACDTVEYLTRRMLWLAHNWVAENLFDAKQKKVIRIIQAEPKGEITHTVLSRKTRAFTTKERMEILENLIDTGQVRKVSNPTAGRARVVYVLP